MNFDQFILSCAADCVEAQPEPALVTVCAWCPPEARPAVPAGAVVTHSCCESCTARVLSELSPIDPRD